MIAYLVAFAASFIFIFLKSWQQQNVVHAKYWWIVPTSMLMATTEVYIIATIAKNGYGWMVLAIGLVSGFGALAATYLHRRILEK